MSVSDHNDPDHSCMVRLIEGDDLALNELMQRWEKPLHLFILRYVGNHADSIELAEETFVRVYHHRSRFNFRSKFSTWLLAIATNLCRHHARWRMGGRNGTDAAVVDRSAAFPNSVSDSTQNSFLFSA